MSESLFARSCVLPVEVPDSAKSYDFVVNTDSVEKINDEIKTRVENLSELSNTVRLQLDDLFVTIQKALCYTMVLEKQIDSQDATLKSENDYVKKRMQSYLKHIEDCYYNFKSYNGFNSVD